MKMMGVIRTIVGGAEVLIETVNPNGQNIFSEMEDTADASFLAGVATEVFQSAKEVISGIAQEISKSIISRRD